MARSSSARWDAGAEVAQLVDRLAATRKYRMIHRDTLRAVAEIEAARVRDPKMLEQLVRQRLHIQARALLNCSDTMAQPSTKIAVCSVLGASDNPRIWLTQCRTNAKLGSPG